jgi:hypothetical protein
MNQLGHDSLMFVANRRSKDPVVTPLMRRWIGPAESAAASGGSESPETLRDTAPRGPSDSKSSVTIAASMETI